MRLGPRLGALLVFVAALGLYLSTLAPAVTFVDSGELIAAARTLGVAHPPGFPLYLLLAHVATRVPLGTVAVRVHVASALAAALAAAAVTLIVMMVGTGGGPWPGLMAGLLVAGSRTLWSYATIAEVYALNTLLLAVLVLLVVKWRTAPGSRWIYTAGFVFGLALGVHHFTILLALPGLAALALCRTGREWFSAARTARLLLWSLGGVLLVYAYLPWAASRFPLLSWGNPDTWQRIWRHATARQYQASFSLSLKAARSQAGEFAELVYRQFGPWWLPLALLLVTCGLVRLWRRDRSLFWCLALLMGVNLAGTLGYVIAEDKDAYYLPVFLAMALAAGFGAAALPLKRLAPLLLLAPVAALAANYKYNNRRSYYLARDYVHNILDTVEPRGMLLTSDWQVYSPMLYTRWIEGAAREAVVIDLRLLRRSWYFDQLRREYPQLMEQARQPVEAFLEDLRNWDQNPRLYDQDPARSRIQSRFHSMVLALIAAHQQSGPAYVTEEVLATRSPEEAPLAAALEKRYHPVAEGLVLRLSASQDSAPPGPLRLRLRGLQDLLPRLDRDDVARRKVLPVYVSMLRRRARLLQAHKRSAEALETRRFLALLEASVRR